MGTAVYDVAVAGAGPAGATAARRLAAAGCRVLLLDAAPLGRDKPCGGGLTARSRRALAGVPLDGMTVTRVPAAEVRRAGARPCRFELGETGAVWMVRRGELDRRLAEAAAAAGAELRTSEPVRAVERDGAAYLVSTARGDVHRARILLLATGAEAALGLALGLRRPRALMAPALEIEAPARAPRIDPGIAVLDFTVPGGYAWAFPKGDGVWNAGVLTGHAHPGPALRAQLAAALVRWSLDFDSTRVHAKGRRIPMLLRGDPLHAGRAALLGDAAALCDRFFGEGIAGALESGLLAAAAALEVLDGRSRDLSPYSRAVHRAAGRHLRRARLAARAVNANPRIAMVALGLLPPARHLAAALATEPFRSPLRVMPLRRVQQPALPGDDHRLELAVRLQLGEDALDVAAAGVQADAQVLGGERR